MMIKPTSIEPSALNPSTSPSTSIRWSLIESSSLAPSSTPYSGSVGASSVTHVSPFYSIYGSLLGPSIILRF